MLFAEALLQAVCSEVLGCVQEGKPLVLKSVKTAEQKIVSDRNANKVSLRAQQCGRLLVQNMANLCLQHKCRST